MSGTGPAQEVTHRGVRWRRSAGGGIAWHDGSAENGRWLRWHPGADAPPPPPGWGPAGARAGGLQRPPWRSRWRVFPIVLVSVAVIIAVVQALRPVGNPVVAEAAASAKLAGKCLARNGSAGGHPKYSATPVACSAPPASVKVVAVLPSTPGGPACPEGATAVELGYLGVRYPHIECTRPVHAGG